MNGFARGLYLQAHSKLTDLYTQKINLQEDQENAKLIEWYLNRIKSAIQSYSDYMGIGDEFVKEIFSRMQECGLDPGQLFNYNKLNNYQSGDQFEKDLVNILQGVIGEKTDGLQVGAQKATSGEYFQGEELQGIYDKFLDQVSEAITTGVKDVVKHGGFQKGGYVNAFDSNDLTKLYTLGEVQGKVDVKVPLSTMIVKAVGNEEIEKFFNLVQGKTFSLKNYQNTVAVKLGNTNLYRVFFTILPQLGFSHPMITKMYYAQQSAQGIKRAIIHPHVFHLRYAYELLGSGLLYNTTTVATSFGDVDYLVINERNGSGIKVYSTRAIISQVLNQVLSLEQIKSTQSAIEFKLF